MFFNSAGADELQICVCCWYIKHRLSEIKQVSKFRSKFGYTKYLTIYQKFLFIGERILGEFLRKFEIIIMPTIIVFCVFIISLKYNLFVFIFPKWPIYSCYIWRGLSNLSNSWYVYRCCKLKRKSSSINMADKKQYCAFINIDRKSVV